MRSCFLASASPILPLRLSSATSTLALLIASLAALRPIASIYPDSSVMSVILTLSSSRPILLSSSATFASTDRRNVSRSALISSMVMEAMTRRSCPKMISLLNSAIASGDCPNRRSAAFPIISGLVLTPTVNTLGTLMRIFCLQRALYNLTSIWSGLSEMYP